MNLTFSSKSSKSCIAFARSSIVRVCGLCSLCFGLVANSRADFTSTDSGVLNDISVALQHLNSVVSNYSPIDSAYLNSVKNNVSSIWGYLSASSVESLLRTLNTQAGYIVSNTGSLSSDLSTLKTQAGYIVSNTGSLSSDLSSIVSLLQNIANTLSNTPPASVGGQDILAGNPWWATNSAFALTSYFYDFAYPSEDPDTTYGFSFPQFLSKWSGFLTRPTETASMTPATLHSSWYNYFGHEDRVGRPTGAKPYTWFEWMSDAMRSNITLVSTMANSTTSDLASDSAAADQDAEDYIEEEDIDTTPEAIPEFEVERPADLTGYSDISDSMSGVLSSFQNKINTNPGSHSSVITVIPEFTVGGIHVDEYTGDLNESGIAATAHGVMAFVWSMMGICFTFQLLSREWAFYTSLGRSVH